MNRAAAAFDTEKLDWLNRHYIKASAPDRLGEALGGQLACLGVKTAGGPGPAAVAVALRERASTLREMAEASVYFYRDFDDFDAAAARKHLRPVASRPAREPAGRAGRASGMDRARHRGRGGGHRRRSGHRPRQAGSAAAGRGDGGGGSRRRST